MAIPPPRDSRQDAATNEDVFFLPWSDSHSANSLAKSDKGQVATRRNDTDDDLVTIRATHAIGIELGATHSSISYLNEHGEPVTIPSRDGELSMPSVVDFHGDRIVVGTEALRNSAKYPGKVVVHAKGYMGDPSHRWKINGKSYSPIDISTLILKSMLDYAHERIGAISQAVITVPAQCSDTQRRATAEAGRRAGLRRVDIVNEPVAAALCFVLGTEGIWFTDLATTQTIMVVDLADETFDLSIVRYHKNEVRVIASSGDPHLGGLDWNRALETAVAKEFQKEFGLDPMKDREAAQALALEAEQAKRRLSVRTRAAMTCSTGGQRKTYEIRLDQFELLTKDLVKRMGLLAMGLLKTHNIDWPKIDVVLTTGGASRIPIVRSLFKRLSGRTLNTSLSPDQSFSHGAAFYAGMLLSNSAFAKSSVNPIDATRRTEFKTETSTAETSAVLNRHVAAQPPTQHSIRTKDTPVPAAKGPAKGSQTTITPAAVRHVSNRPDTSRWDAIVQRHTNADAWALVPISVLARDVGIQVRPQLSAADCRQLLLTADRMGYALEPDPRITGAGYEWNEIVSVFPRGEELAGKLSSYRAASGLLRLGMEVALADGEVDEAETCRLFSHIRSQFTFSEHDNVRLDHLRYLLTKTRQLVPHIELRLRQQIELRLRQQLDTAQRSELGKFLISIAAADGEVSIHERSVLDVIFRGLGIAHLLAPHLAAIKSTEPLVRQDSHELTANQTRPAQPTATVENDASACLRATLTNPAKPAERAETVYDWLAHIASSSSIPVQPTEKPKPTTLDHERIRRIEEEREKLSESLSDVSQPDDVRAEIRPPSMADLPGVVFQSDDRTRTRTVSVAPTERSVVDAWAAEYVSLFGVKSIAPPERSVVDGLVVSCPSRESVTPAPRVTIPQPPSHRFDFDRISRIEAETAKVAEFLRDALCDDDDSSRDSSIDLNSSTESPVAKNVVSEIATANSTSSVIAPSPDDEVSTNFAGLAPRFAPFVDRIARQPTWTRNDLDRLARELGLMLGGAIDIINEWADEHFGDLLLIEEGDSFLVQGELLIDHTGPT